MQYTMHAVHNACSTVGNVTEVLDHYVINKKNSKKMKYGVGLTIDRDVYS